MTNSLKTDRVILELAFFFKIDFVCYRLIVAVTFCVIVADSAYIKAVPEIVGRWCCLFYTSTKNINRGCAALRNELALRVSS